MPVVKEIDVILKLLTWARKCNILFHKNKTILLSFKILFRESIYFRIYVGFPHPGLDVSAPTFQSREEEDRETNARNSASVCGLSG